jgi:3-phenylpropionate/trans-cinnamate dioxygenase ferredoxin subunit
VKRVLIGRLEDFPEGRIHAVEAEGRKLVVVNLEGTLHALDGICTHEYAELQGGFLLAGRITCPLHLSQFDVETGEALNPPAEEPLRKYGIDVENRAVYLLLE